MIDTLEIPNTDRTFLNNIEDIESSPKHDNNLMVKLDHINNPSQLTEILEPEYLLVPQIVPLRIWKAVVIEHAVEVKVTLCLFRGLTYPFLILKLLVLLFELPVLLLKLGQVCYSRGLVWLEVLGDDLWEMLVQLYLNPLGT